MDASGPQPLDATLDQDDRGRERARSRSQAKPRPQVAGYRVEHELGAGSFGEVWLATDLNTGRKVAIKFFSNSQGLDWSLLKREVSKLAEIVNERRVVQLLHVGWEAEPPFYVMEYLPGGSIADRLGGGPMPATSVAAIVRQVAEALVYLHGKAILHCDLKPGNVLLDERDETRLADFGQARLSSDSGPSIGTLFYMAPEQALPRSRPDVRSDIYSLGALAYTMLTGKAPYSGNAGSEKIASSHSTAERIERYRKLIEDSPQPVAHRTVPGVDPALASIVDRCLARNPDDRFDSVSQVLEALDARARAITRRPLALLGVAGAIVLMVVLIAGGLWARGRAIDDATVEIINNALPSARSHAVLVARVVEQNLSAATRQVERAAASPQMQQRIAAIAAGDAGARGALQELTENLRETYADRSIHNWVVADANAYVLARSPFDASVIGRQYTYREWFTGVADQPATPAPPPRPRLTTSVTRPFQSTAQGRALVVSVATPIFGSGPARRVIGVLSATIHLDSFNRWMTDAEQQPEGGCADRFAVLLNHGYVLRHPCLRDDTLPLPPDRFAETDPVRRLIDQQQLTDFVDSAGGGGRYVAATEPFHDHWRAVVLLNRDIVLKPVERLDERFWNIGVIAALLVFAVLAGFLVLLYRFTKDSGESGRTRPTLALR